MTKKQIIQIEATTGDNNSTDRLYALTDKGDIYATRVVSGEAQEWKLIKDPLNE